MKYRNITRKELKEIEETFSLTFGNTVKLEVDDAHYDSKHLKPTVRAGWWGNFITSFMIRVDKKIWKTIQEYIIVNCNIYYNHPGGGGNGRGFYLLKHKDGILWKFFASYQGLEKYVRSDSAS